MKKLIAYLIVGSFLVIGIGCSVEEEANPSEQEVQPPEQEVQQPEEDMKQPDEHETNEIEKDRIDETPKQDEPEAIDRPIVDQLKEKELIGEKLEDVQQLLGEPTIEDKNAVLHAWRYDFPIDGYRFENNLNAVDVEGIYAENMEAQLMVFFENEVVSSYAIYFLKNDEIMQYLVTENGAEEFVASAD